MVLLPVAFGIAILALLVIVRRKRHEREGGPGTPRSLLVRMTLAVLPVVALVYVAVYLVSTLAA